MSAAEQLQAAIREYICGYARHPGSLEELNQVLNAMGARKLREHAQFMLHRRQLSVLDAMSDQELQALADGTVHLATVVRAEMLPREAQEQTAEVDQIDPAVLDTLEAISQRRLRHTLHVRNRDRLDFFEVHAGNVQDALVDAFKAGLLLKT